MKRLVKRALARLGYHVQGTRYTARQLLDPSALRGLELDDVIARLLFERGPVLTFLQVGAFDGVTSDPLCKYIDRCAWRGILVEPQPRATEALRARYHDNDRVLVLQAAIDAAPRRRTLYTVSEAAEPAWVGGLASFDREVLLKHAPLVPGLAAMIEPQEVDCLPFDTVLDRLPEQRLDLLQIDVEGADDFLLALFPFERLRPTIVHFEIKHMSLRRREACLARLQSFGYRFAPSGGEDLLAVAELGQARETR